MYIDEYLGDKSLSRKILIVSDVSRGLALIRKFEAKEKTTVNNLSCMTLEQIAKQIFIYIQSQADFEKAGKIISNLEASMLFRGVVFENIDKLNYFNKEKIIDIATAKEIYAKADLARANGWTGQENLSAGDRVNDLKILIEKYEDKLVAINKYDTTRMINCILEQSQGWSNVEEVIKDIFDAKFAYLSEDMDCLSGIEKKLLSLVQNHIDNEVQVFNDNPSVDKLKHLKDKAYFFKGYGSYNEASFIVNDILKNKYPLGSVAVLYTSSSQLSAIDAAFGGNCLPKRVVTGHLAAEDEYIDLAKRILDWAMDDFSEKKIEAIFASPVAKIVVKNDSDEDVNILNRQGYFDYILNARERYDNSMSLGWGYKRNLDFIAHEKSIQVVDCVEATKKLLNIHKQLLDIFGEAFDENFVNKDILPVDLYTKLVACVKKLSCLNPKEEVVGIKKLEALSGAVSYEDRKLPLGEAIEYINELIQGLTYKDSESSNAVLIKQVNDWVLLDRPIVYVIGLSLKDTQGNATESPVLLDKELEDYLSDGYIPSVKAKRELKEKNLLRSLMSFTGSSITFGYSSYDTVGFCENNPSNIYRVLLSSFTNKTVKNIDEFVYGNPSATTKACLPAEIVNRPDEIKVYATSSTSIESLISCPKKFAYERDLKVPTNEFKECNFDQWLDARVRGLYFHEIAEEYIKQKLIAKLDAASLENVDEDLLKNIIDGIKPTYIEQQPVAFMKMADDEIEKITESSNQYFKDLQREYSVSGWRAIAAELDFVDAKLEVATYISESDVTTFSFRGQIDRVDYKLDEENKTIHLRIADYKTGSKKNKSKEDKEAKLLQYVVYKHALMDTGCCKDNPDVKILDFVLGEISKLCGIDVNDGWEVAFNSFQYEFPMDETADGPLVIKGDQLENANIVRLRLVLTMLKDKKKYYCCTELFDVFDEYATRYESVDLKIKGLVNSLTKSKNYKDAEAKHCEYCNYKDICNQGKGDIL